MYLRTDARHSKSPNTEHRARVWRIFRRPQCILSVVESRRGNVIHCNIIISPIHVGFVSICDATAKGGSGQ
jgi:hypothetical protein